MISELVYPLVKSLLFRLEPEVAHRFCLSFASSFSGCLKQKRIIDPTMLGQMNFPNKIGLAAGFDKNAEFVELFAAMGFGHIEIGTVTPRPQRGNVRPRLFRLEKHEALINRMGFNNAGAIKPQTKSLCCSAILNTCL